ncbi:thioredoxin-like protein [Melampsora americana]|nr:thioredoxin-like protein [Melampsora americana]
MTAQQDVDEAIKSNPIVVYSKSYCPYCRRAKNLLASIPNKVAEPKVFEIDLMGQEGTETQAYLLKLTGQGTVPNIFIGKRHIGGADDLASLHAMGGLEPLLKEPLSHSPNHLASAAAIFVLISALAWFGRRHFQSRTQTLTKEKL